MGARLESCSSTRLIIISSVISASLAALIVGLSVYYGVPSCTESCEVVATTTASTPTTTLPTPAPPVRGLRLPTSWTPSHYDLYLYPDMYTGDSSTFVLDGMIRMHLTCKEASNNITVQFRKLTILNETVKVFKDNGDPVTVSSITMDVPREFYYIHLDQKSTANTGYTVEMNYTCPLKKDYIGIYYSDYIENGQYKYMVATDLESTDSRKAFPCLDEPQLKATYTLNLGYKGDFVTLANMPVERTEPSYRTDWTLAVFQRTPQPMSTYLFAFTVSQYESVTTNATNGMKDKPVTDWSTPELVRKGFLQRSIDKSPIMFDALENIFQHPFDFPKLDQVTVNDFAAGAMENWGMITYLERCLAYDPDFIELSEIEYADSATAHEMAHQWLGNTVTCEWWSHLWLQEGMASFYQYYILKDSHPEWDWVKLFQYSDTWGALDADQTGRSHPLYNPVETPAECGAMFSKITYDKGGAVILMSHYLFLGQQRYDDAMVAYVEKHKYGSVVYEDLISVWAEHADPANFPTDFNVTEAWYTWILQMGFPLVTVGRVTQSNTLTFKQTMFLLDPERPTDEKYPSPFQYKWDVPVSWVQQDAPTTPTTTWLQRNDVDNVGVSSSSKWVVANYMQQGFYRVNYDSDLWDAIIDQLQEDHTVFDPINRAAFIDDAFSISRSGQLSGLTAFRLTRHLVKEAAEFNPWAALTRHLSFINSILMSDLQFVYVQRYMQKLVQRAYRAIDWDVTWDPDTHLLDGYLWREAVDVACLYELPACRSMAEISFYNWMTEDNNYQHIRPDLRDAVYCTAIKWDTDGTRSRFMNEHYDNQTEFSGSGERNRRKNALACSQEIAALNGILAQANETADDSWMGKVARNPAGVGLALDYLDQHWDNTVNGKFNVLSAVAESFSTQADLNKMMAFRAGHIEKDTVEEGRYDDIEYLIKANILWRDNNAQDIFDWVRAEMAPGNGSVDLFLPKTWTPTHYNIRLFPDIYTGNPANFSNTGQVQMYLTCKTTTSEITFHFRKMTIDTATVTDANTGQIIGITSTSLVAEKEFYVITTSKIFNKGDTVKVDVTYSSDLKRDNVGVYYSDWDDENGVVRYMVACHMEPIDARKAFPCLDEPEYKATWNITIQHKSDFTALANAPAAGPPTACCGPDDWVETRFEKTPVVISPYLVSIAVSQYGHISIQTPGGLKSKLLNDWTRPQYIAHGFLNETLPLGADEFDYLEELLGFEYPMPKEDQISIDDFRAGAMENWGLITYLERGLAWDPDYCDLSEFHWSTRVQAHEQLHQWLGDLVTCKWWSHLWLQEGMAVYYQYPASQSVKPKWDQDVIHQYQATWVAMDADSLGTDHPLYNPAVQTEQEINEMFSDITYEKGGSVIRMVKYLILGEESYNIAMQNYTRTMAYTTAVYMDLFDAWAEQALVSSVSVPATVGLREAFSTWVTQMGYPLVTISRQGDTLTLEQTYFLINPQAPIRERYTSEWGYTWHIPVTLVESVSSDQNMTYWLERNNRSDIPVASGSNWVYANVRARGFYRVNYDNTLWDAIITQLDTNHSVIDSVTRAQMIDDSFVVSRSGQLKATVYLRLTQHLTNDLTYYSPWAAVVRALDYMDPILDRDMDYGRVFRPYMRQFVKDLYTKYDGTWPSWTNEELLDGYLGRTAVDVACRYDLPECDTMAKTAFNDWKANSQDPSQYVQTDIRSAVYCSAIKQDLSWDSWNFLFDEYVNFTHFSHEKNKRRDALACTRDHTLLTNYLQRGNDTADSGIMNAVAKNPIGRMVAWEFMDRNWKNMYNPFGLLRSVAKSFGTQADLDMFEDFRFHHLGGYAIDDFDTYNTIRDDIRANIRWKDANAADLYTWIQDNIAL